MMKFPRMSFVAAACSFAIVLGATPLPPSVRAQSEPDTADTLASRQDGIAGRYAKLEELLLRLADVEARENPQRAALLKRVARQSREKFVLEKLRTAGTLISKGELSGALTDQKTATEELRSLLKLLMSEDRSTRIRDEKKRISELIKQLRLTERNERSVRARTENGVEIEEVLKEQEAITKKTQSLSDELSEDGESEPRKLGGEESEGEKSEGKQSEGEASDGKPSPGEKPKDEKFESQPSQSQPSQSQPSESQPSESQPSESQPSESQPSESQPSESQPSESQPSESQPSESQPSESQPSESQPSPSQPSESQSEPSTPPSPQQEAEQQVRKAIEQMQEAMDKLSKDDRKAATQKQRQAEEELRQAIDRLEKILRQLREEEIERELAKLEARLRRMAAMQSEVLDQTVQLAQTPKSQRTRTTDLKAGELAFEEQKITLEADRAMLLLKEEGSSVAFPEVVLQMRNDTQRVAERLFQSKIDGVTQGIQNDILAALEEMIAALEQAQRDLEKKKQQQQQGQQSQQGSGEEPLVQAIAELKLLRTMQTRIQGTTNRYGNLLDAEDASGEDVLPLLQDLSGRQDRLYQITRDLVTKRNQ